MLESRQSISNWRKGADICGFLSLLCGLPLLILILAGGGLHLPDQIASAIIRTIFISPFAGALLALTAATGRRRWLVLLTAWLAILAFGWWDLAHHPFDL